MARCFMPRSSSLGHRQPGQTLVIAAVALVALLAFVGLVVNMGLLFVERRHLQATADAVALAGTWEVIAQQTAQNTTAGDAAVRDRLNALACLNQVAVTTCPTLGAPRVLVATYVDQDGHALGSVGGGTLPAPATGVQVGLAGPFNVFLAGFVGQSQLAVSSSSTARLATVSFPNTLVGPLPLAVPLGDFSSVGAYDLFANGNSFVLDLAQVHGGGSAAPTYHDPLTDIAANLQDWSDGTHDSGSLACSTSSGTLACSQVTAIDATRAQRGAISAGLRLRQLLTNNGPSPRQYVVADLPVCDPCSLDPYGVQVVGFARVHIDLSDIDPSGTSLHAHFVPYVDGSTWQTPPAGVSAWPAGGPLAPVLVG